MLANEEIAQRRRAAIERLGVLDRIADPTLTALTRVAATLTGAASAAVHIVDDGYQHRIAATNVEIGRHPAEDAMCTLVVDGEEPVVCEDAPADPRFRYSSFTHGEAPVRFYVSVPLRLADDTVVGTLCAFDSARRSVGERQVDALVDLAAQAISHVELMRIAIDLEHAASRDPLTGALNRLALADRIEHALARRDRHGTDVLVAVIDVNGFKAINDRHGHAAGDEILVRIVERIGKVVRAEDSVGRIGGDEFAVVAELENDSGRGIVQRRVEGAFPIQERTVGAIAISTGWATAEKDDGAPSLLARADKDLYARKRALAQT